MGGSLIRSLTSCGDTTLIRQPRRNPTYGGPLPRREEWDWQDDGGGIDADPVIRWHCTGGNWVGDGLALPRRNWAFQ
jgi:hypothetical protein